MRLSFLAPFLIISATLASGANARVLAPQPRFPQVQAIPAGSPPLHTFVAPADRGIAADVARVPDSRDIRDFGPIVTSRPVEIGVLMRVRHQAQLESLVVEQGERTSRYYHKYLTKAEYNAYFAPTAQTYSQTIATLVSRGFRITGTLPNRSMIRATAPAATVERYFSTEIHGVYQAKYGFRYMNVRPAVMPAELRDAAVSISGLHSIVSVHFPIRFGDKAAIRNSSTYARALAFSKLRGAVRPISRTRPHVPLAAATEPPIGTSTPKPPGPDPTESPENANTDYLTYYGYGPPIYATGYDYPVEHGYGGKGIAAGSVISNDYLDSDAALEYKTFNIKRTGTTNPLGYRVCTDPNPTANCDGLIGAGDPEGESTLDALTILSLAPAADFYEYLAPNLNDIGIEYAYERAVSDDVVSVLNSSFGACETSDPSFEYSTNYIALEGASLGITFSASAGDTGAYSCGVYASNGPPQTERDISTPAGDTYFTDVGGTSYLIILPTDTSDYDMEAVWPSGGGGISAYEPIPAWQKALQAQSAATALTSATYRNTPDIAMCADPGTNPDGFVGGYDGVSEVIVHNGTLTPAGGTSLASPMWVAMQTEIDEVQHSRNGFVDPALDAIAAKSSAEYAFGFKDITVGTNLYYLAETGMDDASGIGSPRGWELAGAPEYGTPGGPTPAPLSSPGASPAPTIAPISTATPHPVGANFVVTTLVGSECSTANASIDGNGNKACLANPTGIVYVPAASALNTAAQTDPTLFVNDFTTGFLRGYNVTSTAVVTYNSKTWNNATRKATAQSNLYGLGYLAATSNPTADGLYVAGNGTVSVVSLPTTPNPAATPATPLGTLGNVPAAIAFNATGTDAGTVDSIDTNFYVSTFAGVTPLTLAATSTLPTGGNFGIVYDGGAALPEYAFTNDGLNEVEGVLDLPDEAMTTAISEGTPLNDPKGITYLSSTKALYVANCRGNNIVRIDATTFATTIVAGDGAPAELDGKNTGAAFDCPFGITNDGTNLYVTDAGGNTVRKITSVI